MRNYVELPNNSGRLTIGSKVRLGRFSQDVWVVNYGWYAWGNNRRTLGWYFFNASNQIKPLQETDLHDIYCIESGQPCEPEFNDIMYRINILESQKQNKLQAGNGINISAENVIQTTFPIITEYSQLPGKPTINGVTIQGNLTSEDLNIHSRCNANEVYFDDGSTFQTKYDSGELRGRDGDPGKNGLTPHIGPNTNWFIGDTDTGKPSKGHTPVKGVDYFTQQDIDAIVTKVVSSLPVYRGEVISND